MGNQPSSSSSSSIVPLRSTLHGLSTGDDVGKLLGQYALNKRIMVTGASSGLGFETARVLANCGATVIIATLPQFTATTLQQLRSLVPHGSFESIDIDLSNLRNVREAVHTYTLSGKDLHILINNAGIMACPLSSSHEGYELQFAINYLGHFLFTELLLPILDRTAVNSSSPSRIINLSSAAHCLLTPPEQGIYWDRLPLHALTELKTVYDPWECYGISKLCLANYASYLQYRYSTTKYSSSSSCISTNNPQHNNLPRIIACSVHPGAILTTGLKQHVGLSTFMGMVSKTSLWGFTVFSPSIRNKSPVTKSIPQGAATTLTVALDPDIVPGAYYSDCQPVPEGDKYLSPFVHDQKFGEELYRTSRVLVQESQKAITRQEYETFRHTVKGIDLQEITTNTVIPNTVDNGTENRNGITTTIRR